MVVYTLEQRWEVGLQSTYKRCRSVLLREMWESRLQSWLKGKHVVDKQTFDTNSILFEFLIEMREVAVVYSIYIVHWVIRRKARVRA